jgi:hypothetical protein
VLHDFKAPEGVAAEDIDAAGALGLMARSDCLIWRDLT